MRPPGGTALPRAGLLAHIRQPHRHPPPLPQTPAPRRFLAVPARRGPLHIQVVYPPADAILQVRDSNFMLGSVGSGDARLTINGQPVKVWPNGAWLAYLPFRPTLFPGSSSKPATPPTRRPSPTSSGDGSIRPPRPRERSSGSIRCRSPRRVASGWDAMNICHSRYAQPKAPTCASGCPTAPSFR